MISNLNLNKYARDPTIASSIAWNAVKESLVSLWCAQYVDYITSVKVTDCRITIRTGKPIINQELSHHREIILERIQKGLEKFWEKRERKIIFL